MLQKLPQTLTIQIPGYDHPGPTRCGSCRRCRRKRRTLVCLPLVSRPPLSHLFYYLSIIPYVRSLIHDLLGDNFDMINCNSHTPGRKPVNDRFQFVVGRFFTLTKRDTFMQLPILSPVPFEYHKRDE